MPVPATITDVFADNVLSEQTVSDTMDQGNTGDEQRTWLLPKSWDGDALNIKELKTPFEREEINQSYQDVFPAEDGRIADALALKLQGDYVACEERAFRLRHASHVRCVMHAANRRHGHAMKAGGVLARVIEHVQDVIVSRNAGD